MNLDLEVYHCVNILPFHFVFTSIMVHNGLALTFSAAEYLILHCTSSESEDPDEDPDKTFCISPFLVWLFCSLVCDNMIF